MPLRRVRASALLALAWLPLSVPAAPLAAQLPDHVEDMVEEGLEAWPVAGLALGVVRGDSLVVARGWGVEDVRTGEPVTPETLFAIGSNSKLFTAVAAGMMVDDGRMDWDDRAVEHLPGFRLHDPWVTGEMRVVDLLSHRSGLGRRGDMLWYASPWDREEVLRRIRHLEPNTSFRSAYGYQNVMFLAAGQAVASAAGRSWDEVVEERIFRPLGMATANTSVTALRDDGSAAQPHLNPDGELVPVPWRNLDNVAPAGSINASVRDMAPWLRFLIHHGRFRGEQLLDSATLRTITSPHTIMSTAPDPLFPSRHFLTYGLGVVAMDYRGEKVLWHTGGIDGMLSAVAVVPERELGVVVLTNTSGRNQLFTAVMYAVLDAYLGAEPRDYDALFLERQEQAEAAAEAADTVPDPEGPASLEPAGYAGTYRSELYGDLEVTHGAGGLAVRFGPHLEGPLEHAWLDTFRADWEDPAADESLVTFHLGADARPAAAEVEGLGRFERVEEGP